MTGQVLHGRSSHRRLSALGAIAAFLLAGSGSAAALEPALAKSVESKRQMVAEWAKDPQLIQAVREANESPSKLAQGLTQQEWDALSAADQKVRYFQNTSAAQFLSAKRRDWVSEAFVSALDGTKIGFLAKTTFWSHRGQEKHEQPVHGRMWRGELELDESAGREQVQISVPILDEGKPIGSLVVGIDAGKL